MSKDRELKKEFAKYTMRYLGKANIMYIKKTSESESKMFQNFLLDMNSSYLIYGNEEILNKFRAFYLTRCTKTRPLYSQYHATLYAEALTSDSKDEYGLNIDQDLIFLYIHEHSISSLGKSETWFTETLLNKITSRNRDGLVTIVLSEVRVPSLEDKSELNIINLNRVAIEKTVGIATKDIAKNSQASSSVCY